MEFAPEWAIPCSEWRARDVGDKYIPIGPSSGDLRIFLFSSIAARGSPFFFVPTQFSPLAKICRRNEFVQLLWISKPSSQAQLAKLSSSRQEGALREKAKNVILLYAVQTQELGA